METGLIISNNEMFENYSLLSIFSTTSLPFTGIINHATIYATIAGTRPVSTVIKTKISLMMVES